MMEKGGSRVAACAHCLHGAELIECAALAIYHERRRAEIAERELEAYRAALARVADLVPALEELVSLMRASDRNRTEGSRC